MASLNDCIYAMYIVMIIAWNNVHLFQQQSDKLYLCCTFGLLAWTLLSNISQLGLLLTHKPCEQLSTNQCFLDVVLFQSTTKRHFFALRFSTLLVFHSPCLAPQAVGQRKQRILSSISCVPPVSTASSRRYKGWPKKLHFTTQLGKMPLKPLQSTQETSPLPTVPQELPGGLADHLRMSLYKSDRQAFLCCTHMTASLSLQGCCVFNGQPAAETLMLLLYFRERKKA